MKIHHYFFLPIIFLASLQANAHQDEKPMQSHSNRLGDIFTIDCSIRALGVENDSTCWFAGSKNTVGFTKDYGKTWQKVTIKHDNLKLQFRSLAVTSDAVFVFAIGTPALLFKIDKESLSYELVYHEKGEKVFYNTIHFWDDLNGIATGDPTARCMSVIRTRDGGNTWTRLACDELPKLVENEAAFAASNTNVCLTKRKAFVVTGGKVARVWVGDAYGKKWDVYETPMAQGEKMSGIYSADFSNEKLGIIAGGNWETKARTQGAMAITQDGGKRWQLLPNSPGFISCVQFIPNSENLIACSTTGIYYSNSLGKSWRKLSDVGFYGFRFSAKGDYMYFSGQNKLMSVKTSCLLGL